MTPVAGPFEMVSSWLAIFSGMAVFCPDYRLQPGHVYPAAHEDCWTVYRELEQSGTLAGLVGDSSGGVLALAMMLRARAAGLGLPALCVLLSPTVDYGFTDQGIWDAQDVFGNPTLFKKMHQGYVAGADLRCADLTPIQENLAGLPQLEVFVGEAEILRKESDRLVEALEGVGRLNLHPAVGMWHGWYVMADVLPEGRATLRQAAESIAAAAKEKRGPARRSPS